MSKFFQKAELSSMDKKGVAVVKCGEKVAQGCFLAANKSGEAVLSKSRFDVVGIALENGEKDDMIKMRLY